MHKFSGSNALRSQMNQSNHSNRSQSLILWLLQAYSYMYICIAVEQRYGMDNVV